MSACKRVLIVEDDEDNRKILCYHLRRFWRSADDDLEIVEASHGKDAVECVAADTPDLVIMDINMPEMNGFEAASIIRSLDGPAANVPIIALTAESLDGDPRMIEHGVSDFIQKPLIDPAALEQKINFWLARTNATEEPVAAL